MFSCVCVANSRYRERNRVRDVPPRGATEIHTDGHRTTPTGPSPFSKGSLISSSSAIIISGSENAKVFPEPVNAIPIISRPENLKHEHEHRNVDWESSEAHAIGRPWAWIGVGSLMPLLLKNFSNEVGILISYNKNEVQTPTQKRCLIYRRTVKLVIGGAMSSPSTNIEYFSRILWFCSSLRSRINLGGRHLKDENQ